MILLHVMVVALYGLTAYALWPATAGQGASGRPADRIPAGVVAWLLPMALLLHACEGMALTEVARGLVNSETPLSARNSPALGRGQAPSSGPSQALSAAFLELS